MTVSLSILNCPLSIFEMYTRDEISKYQQQFWTTFGKYMQPVLSAEGEKINWINYRTGVNGIRFKMYGDQFGATIGIYLVHSSAEQQQEVFEKLEGFKDMLNDILEEEWEWQLWMQDEYGKIVSAVSTSLKPVNMYDQKNWPALISFFKTRITRLDEWWSSARQFFE